MLREIRSLVLSKMLIKLGNSLRSFLDLGMFQREEKVSQQYLQELAAREEDPYLLPEPITTTTKQTLGPIGMQDNSGSSPRAYRDELYGRRSRTRA